MCRTKFKKNHYNMLEDGACPDRIIEEDHKEVENSEKE
jgi:hypothetical protein